MFSSSPNYTKLKTNLRLSLNRLKLLEKKKAELAQKSRKEIADYLATSKIERARIRVEHIIREDYLVEAMEIVEMYCDLLLARFGLVTQMKELDAGIAEAVSSIVWVSPRMQNDITELKVISDIFIQKYGPQFAEHTRTATGNHCVSEKLMHKLQLQAPPKLLVEKYLIEIAKNYNIEYEPDPQIMKDDQKSDNYLIDLSDRNNLGGGGGSNTVPPQMGFIGYPQPPALPAMPEPPSNKPFNYPPPYGGGGMGVRPHTSSMPSAPFTYNIPPNAPQKLNNDNLDNDLNINVNFIQEEIKNVPEKTPDGNYLNPHTQNQFLHRTSPPPRYSSINHNNFQKGDKPNPQPRTKIPSPTSTNANNVPPPYTVIPDLPNVPSDLPDLSNDNSKANNDDDIDFDALSKRFEELKKRK